MSVSLHFRQDIGYMKDWLDTLLREWKPRNFDQTKIQSHAFRVRDILWPIWPGSELMNLQCVASIENEHCIFATFAKALTPPDKSNTIFSSFIVTEHFIHSYHFTFRVDRRMDHAIFLILITYSRHNTRFLGTHNNVHLIDGMQAYLTLSCSL